MYINSAIEFDRRKDLETDKAEIMWLQLNPPKSKSFLVGYVYRPPKTKANIDRKIEQNIEQATTQGKDIYVLGDVNVDLLKGGENKPIYRNLMSFGLDQLIWEVTRPASQACLDHIYINNPDMTYSTTVIPIGLSDHYPVVVVRKHNGSFAKMDTHKTIKYRNFKQFDEKQFLEDLESAPWNILDITNDPNECLDLWEQMYLDIINKHAPLITKRVKMLQQPPWWNDDISSAIVDRDYLLSICSTNKHDTAAKILYQRARNKVNYMIRDAKKEFYSEVLQGNDPKEKWKAIRATISSTTSVGPKLHKEKNKILNANEIANAFNKHFIEIGAKYLPEETSSLPEYDKLKTFIDQQKPSGVLFNIPLVSEAFIQKQIRKMSSSKATGLDGISVKLLKISVNVVSPHITKICNLSISSGIFPDKWKNARVLPMYKSGDTNDVSNYRPISVLPVCSKILERHVYDHYYRYLMKYKLLLDQQSGFRKHHSCQTILLKLTDYLIANIDAGKLNGMILIDLRKAFDLVNHDLLVHKISLYGCSSVSTSWFKSYLSKRHQCVLYDGHVSDLLPIKLGVPQGSILGPLMFILFMNDVVLEVENGSIEMYADDSSMYTCGKTVTEVNDNLTRNSQPVYKWIVQNRMVLNIQKTECILIGTVQRLKKALDQFSVGENEYKITPVTSHKLLGTYVDSSLSWELHINKLCAKVRSRLYVFNKTKYLLSHEARKEYFNGLVQPIIDYNCVVWGNCSRKCLITIHKTMKRFGRSILEVRKCTDISSMELFKRLEWLPVDSRIEYFEGVQMYNIVHGNCPQYLRDMIQPVDSVHSRSTRESKQKLYVKKANLVTGQRAFSIRGPMLWNSIDSTTKNATSIEVFKKRLMGSIRQNAFEGPKLKLDQPKYVNEMVV